MKIQELNADTKLDFIQSILAPFAFPMEKQTIVLNNFRNELQEIGTNRTILLGSQDHVPVSTVQLIWKNADNNPNLANGIDIAHVHNLWTRLDHQRQGFAEQMMLYCEDLARRRGIKTLTLGVDEYNSVAIALYKKLGYLVFEQEEGRTPQEKLFLMRKSL